MNPCMEKEFLDINPSRGFCGNNWLNHLGEILSVNPGLMPGGIFGKVFERIPEKILIPTKVPG